MGGALRSGSESTRRAAIASASDAFQSPSGSLAIVCANTRAAVSRGRSDRRAASCHGSMPSRVRAVNTVSGADFLLANGGEEKRVVFGVTEGIFRAQRHDASSNGLRGLWSEAWG